MADPMEEFLTQNFDNLVKTITDFVKIENQSRSFDPDWATNGKNLEVCKFAVKYAESLKLEDFTIEILEEKPEEKRTPVVLAIADKKNAPTILMYGHLDKQPPLTEQWTDGLKPYVPEIRGDRLYGRGSADDGYAFFTSSLILKALQINKLQDARVVLFFETDEESGSKDLVYFLEKNAEKIGVPDLVICLDSGCVDYDHLCITTTLRGVTNFSLKVEVTKEGVHSGASSGIIPDSFRIGRKILEQLEVSENGQLLIPDLYVNIPDDKYKQAFDLVNEMGGKIEWKFPFLDGVKPTVEDTFKQYLNRNWHPQLTLIGMDGVPNIINAGNVLRPWTNFGLSLRLPPTLSGEKAKTLIENFFQKVAKPYNAKVTIDFKGVGQGFNCPTYDPKLKANIEESAKNGFGKSVLYYGEGGSIPFINELNAKFPKSQFIVTGVLGPESNAHGPNEFLHIPYLKKIMFALAHILKNYKL